jgi:hypothetical protein
VAGCFVFIEEQPLDVPRWQPPWPMIAVSDCEWLIVRDDPARPAAVVRYLPDGPSGGRYRVVRWAPRSEDRRLFGYLPTLEKADMAVTSVEREPQGRTAPPTSERPADWERFERWFWSQASDRLVRYCAPTWVIRERLASGR